MNDDEESGDLFFKEDLHSDASGFFKRCCGSDSRHPAARPLTGKKKEEKKRKSSPASPDFKRKRFRGK